MSDEIDRIKADLHRLNCHIVAERNDEVRHMLQRSRLERERAEAQVKLMDAVIAACVAPVMVAPKEPAIQIGPANMTQQNGSNGQNGYRITLAAAKMPSLRLPPLPEISPPIPAKSRKPEGLPSIAKMIMAALENAAKHGQAGLKPGELTKFVRQTWWPEVRGEIVCSTAWHLAKAGKLAKDGAIYKLNGSHPA
jgi:hypothetical protein